MRDRQPGQRSLHPKLYGSQHLPIRRTSQDTKQGVNDPPAAPIRLPHRRFRAESAQRRSRPTVAFGNVMVNIKGQDEGELGVPQRVVAGQVTGRR